MPINCLTRRSFAVLLAAGLLLSGGWSTAIRAQSDEDPVDFLRSLQDDTIERLSVASLSEEDREQHFRHIFNDNFDLPAIGRFVVGRYWKRASEATCCLRLALF